MLDRSVFDKLVSQMSVEERHALRAKLTATKPENDAGLAPESGEDLEANWDQHYRKLSWFSRLILALKALFSGKTLQTLVEERMLSHLGSRLERALPGGFHARLNMLYPSFYEELRLLTESLAVFRRPLSAAFGLHKADFFAYLVGTTLEEVQNRLLTETDPLRIYEANPERTNKDIKAILDGNFRVILESIPTELRRQVFENVKSLFALKVLCGVNEEKLLKPFLLVGLNGGPGSCSIDDLKGALTDLWDRLSLLATLPTVELLEALFLFQASSGETPGETAVHPDQQVSAQIPRIRDALSKIRSFQKRIPLRALVCFATRDLNPKPKNWGGVEDWFLMYKNFWKQKIDTDFQVFAKERNEKALVEEILKFLDLNYDTWQSEHFYPPYHAAGLTQPKEKSLKLIRFFWQQLFQNRLNPHFKVILLDGEFYKKQNRALFTESYNYLLKIPDKLNLFQRGFSAEGEWGQRLSEARNLKDEALFIPQLKEIFLSAGDWAQVFIKEALEHFRQFQQLLEGIIKGEAGGRFDTLVNLGQLGGRNNVNFRKELEGSLRKWETFLRLLGDLQNVE